MVIVNGVNRTIGLKILANSFSADRLVTRRHSAYSINSEDHIQIRVELRPSKSRISSQIVLFAI